MIAGYLVKQRIEIWLKKKVKKDSILWKVLRTCRRIIKFFYNIIDKDIPAMKRGMIIAVARRATGIPLPGTRSGLPLLLNHLNLAGKGAEIGVWAGEFSEEIIKKSNFSILFSVDPWKRYDEKDYEDQDNISQELFEQIYNQAVERLKKFGQRSKIIRDTSRNACSLFADGTLDFIFIDANHSYGACKDDLEIWWPKLRKKGVFAGHDYLNGALSTGVYGVKRAVNEFVAKHRQRLYVTCEKDYPAWYLIKR